MASKYNARKVKVGEMVFDSKKEAKRYETLKRLEEQGIISDLKTQVSFLLIPAQYETVTTTDKKGKTKTKKLLLERKVNYVADFVYTQDGKSVVEDVKGYRKGGAYSLFVLKRKLMLQVWGIRVREV